MLPFQFTPKRLGVAGELAAHTVSGTGGQWYSFSGVMRTINRSASILVEAVRVSH